MAKPNGFIVLHRKLVDWEWYKKPSVKDVFIHLLLTANFVDGRFEGQLIRRGQLATSLPSLSAGTGLSLQQVRTALKHLSATGEITDNANRRYRVITVVKYDEYQSLTDRLTVNQQSNNSQLTDNQQTTNSQLTDNQQQYNNITNKQGNNVNKGTIETYAGGFDVFWNEYPKKVDKQNALKAWKKLKPDEAMLDKIISAIRSWKDSEQWNKENGQYIPYPATWLNKRRWEDDLPGKKKQSDSPKRVIAQDFPQRDYSSVNDDMMSSLAAEIEQARRDGII